MSSPTYVYGVVAAGAPAAAPRDGVCGQPVRIVEAGAVAAVASTLPEPELRARRRDLQAHLAVLGAVFERTTIVPCSFGTVFSSDASVRDELLVPRRDDLVALLEQLDGRVQFTLGAAYDEDSVLREVVAAEPEIARLREQTRAGDASTYFARVRLGELVAGALEARRERDAAAIAEAVAPHVEAVVEDDARRRVLKVSLLVARDRVPGFERAVEQLAAAGGGRILYELVGPLPPTAFVELAGAEAAAWA